MQSYFGQASEISRLLNIKLTTRSWDGHRILMCGFPIMQLDKYLKILVQQNNRFVAMCEEFSRAVPGDPKARYDRRVVRVITPGTLIDEPFLNQYANNYLLAIHTAHESPTTNPVGLAWIDVSTGEFYAKVSPFEVLRDDLARICPREIVLNKSLEPIDAHPLRQMLVEDDILVSYIEPLDSALPSTPSAEAASTDDLTAQISPLSSSAYTSHETCAVNLLTTFLRANLLEHMPKLGLPNREADEGRMQIDAHTIEALEIREGLREGGVTGSLLSVIKRTITSSGTRLLARWLCECQGPGSQVDENLRLATPNSQVPRVHRSKRSTPDSHS
jgi:DNA mismatch repair ATPase MutS